MHTHTNSHTFMHTHSQNVITENPFTDPMAAHEGSPIEIGEPLGSIPENGIVRTHHRKQSNPFRPVDEATVMWEMEKQQFTAQMTLLREQLKQETTARIESQVRNLSLHVCCYFHYVITSPLSLFPSYT